MSDVKISSRRVVKRPALAAGCSLWAPIALAADDPQKNANTSNTAATSVSSEKRPLASALNQGKLKCRP